MRVWVPGAGSPSRRISVSGWLRRRRSRSPLARRNRRTASITLSSNSSPDVAPAGALPASPSRFTSHATPAPRSPAASVPRVFAGGRQSSTQGPDFVPGELVDVDGSFRPPRGQGRLTVLVAPRAPTIAAPPSRRRRGRSPGGSAWLSCSSPPSPRRQSSPCHSACAHPSCPSRTRTPRAGRASAHASVCRSASGCSRSARSTPDAGGREKRARAGARGVTRRGQGRRGCRRPGRRRAPENRRPARESSAAAAAQTARATTAAVLTLVHTGSPATSRAACASVALPTWRFPCTKCRAGPGRRER